MAFPSPQDKTVTFNLDHNPVCFYWRPDMSSGISLVGNVLPKQLNQSLITGLTALPEVTELSLNQVNLVFK